MKIFYTTAIMGFSLAIQAVTPPKAVLFVDRQTVYKGAKTLKDFEAARARNADDLRRKMEAVKADEDAATLKVRNEAADIKSPAVNNKIREIRQEYAAKNRIIIQENAAKNAETDRQYNATAGKLWDIMEDIMKAEDACAVMDYSGGDQKKVIDPRYDITQRVIDTLNKNK